MKTNYNNIWQKCSWRNLQQNYLNKSQIYSLSITTLSFKMTFNFIQYNHGTLKHSNIVIQKAFVVTVNLLHHILLAWHDFANVMVQYHFYLFL